MRKKMENEEEVTNKKYDLIVKKCGRKSSISDLDFQKMMLIHQKSIFEYGTMLPLSHPIIKDMAHNLQVTDRCIYLKIKRHLNSKSNYVNVEKCDTGESEDENDNAIEIVVSTENRLKLLPIVPDNINMLKRCQMPVNWTYTVATLLWECGVKTPCSYIFANGNLIDNELVTTAKCSECEACFKINSEQNFKKIIVYWINKGTENTYHKKKRRITANVRKQISEDLVNSSATCYRRQQGRALMKSGDPTPATIANAGTTYLLNTYV